MEGSCDYLTQSKHTNADKRNSYPASEAGTADGYDGSESGVEPDYTEWVFDSSQEAEEILFDMSDEQAMAALRYFTSTAQRTNMLTKTHSNDLELIAQLLSDKEKDLEMTAKIGQSLLQRNKQLMMKIETMEDYLSQTTENAAQLEHDLQMKSKLVQLYAQDDETRSTSSNGSKEDKCLDDQELVSLTNRCRKLEKDNQNLFSEALNLRQMTDEMEDKEETLVMDCIEQLASAKQQITQLTDEIALKFEDNLQQQMEISQLINMVVELQRRQKQLVEENGDLQEQLVESNENQENLRDQLYEMQTKFRETKELMIEHQEELKSLKSRLDVADNPCDWLSDSGNSITPHDSLANEIEESVRRDLTSSLAMGKRKVQNRRLLENVRYLNIKGSDTTSGRTSPSSTWSLASDERSEPLPDTDNIRVRKPTRKLQIVKPMEGSDTLNKWHHLASKNIKGGLDVSSEETQPPRVGHSTSSSMEDFDISVINRDPASQFEVSNMDTSTDDGISVNLPVPRRPRIEKSSSPQGKPVRKPGRVIDLSTPSKKTIITRNSSALKSLREGRKLLNSQQKGGRSQADVIDMIAAAMGKVNVEAKAGQRILSSLNLTPTHDRHDGHARADYTSMPNVAKALEKAAQINENVEPDKSSKILSENDSSNYDSGTEEFNYSTVTNSEYNSTTRSSSTRTSSTRTPETSLHSVTGPLGLLNRANPSEPSPDIMNNLLRYSGTQNKPNVNIDSYQNLETTVLNKGNETIRTKDDSKIHHQNSSSLTTLDIHDNVGEKHHSLTSDAEKEHKVISRNMSGGSLLDMIANNTRKSRPLGLSNLVSRVHSANNSPSAEDKEYLTSIDGPEPELGVDDKTRTKASDANSISQSMETGLDSMKEESSGIFGFFSFLGKLS